MRCSSFWLPPTPRHRERGFALLIVLWALVFITLIITQVTATGREELRIAGNLVANAQARAAADGAIYDAIFHLSDPRPDQRWQPGQSEHKTEISDSSVTLTIVDESARINPNLASPALLMGLLRAVGIEPDAALDLATAIGEWVGSVQPDPAGGDAAAQYKAAGLDYAPPGAPAETLDELAQIRGMTPGLLMGLRSHLTLFGPPDPNPISADSVVAAAISFANGGGLSGGASGSTVVAKSDFRIVRIRATALGPNRAKVIRVAVVRVGDGNAQGYTPLSWRDGV